MGKFPIAYLLGCELMNQTITPLMKQAAADLDRMALDSKRFIRVERVGDRPRRHLVSRDLRGGRGTPGVDLVVLTTRGYTGPKHAWLGSNTLCATLVVPHWPCARQAERGCENSLTRMDGPRTPPACARIAWNGTCAKCNLQPTDPLDEHDLQRPCAGPAQPDLPSEGRIELFSTNNLWPQFLRE